MDEAEADACAALAVDDLPRWQRAASLAALVEVLVERDRLDHAERELAEALSGD